MENHVTTTTTTTSLTTQNHGVQDQANSMTTSIPDVSSTVNNNASDVSEYRFGQTSQTNNPCSFLLENSIYVLVCELQPKL